MTAAQMITDNNTFVNCTGTAVVFMGSNISAAFKNNIIYDCGTGFYTSGTDVAHTNNLLYGCATNYSGAITQGSAEITTANPLLDGTYHLQSGSPAIDAGVYVGLPFNGNFPDLGAYESSFTQTLVALQGRITSASSGLGVPNALVSAGISGNRTGTTDVNGNYSIQTPGGSQTVTVSQAAYNTSARTVTVAGSTTIADFQLTQASARTYYVSPIGNDSNSGLTTDAPWESIDNGDRNDMLNPGDTVTVLAGDYYSAAPVVIGNCSGTASLPITYVASGGTPYVDGEVAQYGFTIGPASYNVVNGLTLTGSDSPLVISGATGAEVLNCTISTVQYSQYGVWTTNSTNCKIHHNIIGPNMGVYGSLTSDAMSEDTGNGNQLCNNTIIGSSGWGIDFSRPSTGRVLKNNLLYTCFSGINCSSTGATHSHNMQYLTTQQTYYGGIMRGLGESASSNPLFIDPTNGNYNLQTVAGGYSSTSPAVDTGTLVGFQFQGLWPDIGALESAGTAYPGVGTISGEVTETTSGLGVYNAMLSTGTQTNAYAYSDANGNYTLQLPIRTQTVTAAKTNYNNLNKSLNIVAGTQTVNWALVGPRVVKRLSDIKGLATGTRISITSAMVATASSSTFSGTTTFYIEQPDRTDALRIIPRAGLQSVALGDNITLTGFVATDATGQYIDTTSIDSDTSGTPLTALGMGSRSVANLPCILVRIWGVVGTRTTNDLYVDDGAIGVNDGTGNGDGVRVRLTGLTTPISKTIGTFLSVSGILSVDTDGALVLLPRGDADIN